MPETEIPPRFYGGIIIAAEKARKKRANIGQGMNMAAFGENKIKINEISY